MSKLATRNVFLPFISLLFQLKMKQFDCIGACHKCQIVVWQWRNNSIRNRHSLHPTFTHGSTLGIYEVLVGKAYICDMVTDSVVLCFFVESEKILSAARSDAKVEDFLWKVFF